MVRKNMHVSLQHVVSSHPFLAVLCHREDDEQYTRNAYCHKTDVICHNYSSLKAVKPFLPRFGV